MRVGSADVLLQNGLYFVAHRSKLAFHFMFKVFRMVIVASSVRLTCNKLYTLIHNLTILYSQS